jgi:hypothetical protein
LRPTGVLTRQRVVAALAFVVFSLAAPGAIASSGTTLTGTAEWTDVGLSTTTTIHGTFTGKMGNGTYSGTLAGGPPVVPNTDFCGPVCENVTGTITFSSKRGDLTATVEPGSVVGLFGGGSTATKTFSLTLNVISGTRSYAHADGTLSLFYADGTLSLFYVSTHFVGFVVGPGGELIFIDTIHDSGTLTGNPR